MAVGVRIEHVYETLTMPKPRNKNRHAEKSAVNSACLRPQ
jgi:hypothetical protein